MLQAEKSKLLEAWVVYISDASVKQEEPSKEQRDYDHKFLEKVTLGVDFVSLRTEDNNSCMSRTRLFFPC